MSNPTTKASIEAFDELTSAEMPSESLSAENRTQEGAKMTNSLLDAALSYAQRGWHVLLLKPQDKTPLTRHGVKDATTSEAKIHQWWTRNPQANIGIACGPSRLVVVDVDDRKGGGESWKALKEQYAIDDDTVVSITGGGGLHYLFAAPDGVTIGNSAGKLGPGLDVRGQGGYIVAPPSSHPETGRAYAWEVNAHPDDRDPAPLPAPLIKLLAEDGEQATARAPAIPPVRIPNGQRNNTLFRYACRLRGDGLSENELLSALEALNNRCEPPLTSNELRKIASSASRYPVTSAPPRARPLGQRPSEKEAKAIVALAPSRSPDPGLRQAIKDALLRKKDGKSVPAMLRREKAGQLLLAWLGDHGGFTRSRFDDLFYFYQDGRRLFNLNTIHWKAWLYCLTGANPAGPDYPYLEVDCQVIALSAPARDIVRLAAWDGVDEVLRVSRFDGTVYVLDGETITKEPNGYHVLFDDDPLWLPYQPIWDEPGPLNWLSEFPNWDGDGETLGLGFRTWVLSLFLTELCPADKPLLGTVGEKDSGKTTLLRLTLQLLFGPLAQVEIVPNKPDAFDAAIAASHWLIYDNLDEFTPWLRDKLACLSTGGRIAYRKYYTSKEVGYIDPRCWFAFTSRTPETLRRDDLADRLLLLPVKRIQETDRTGNLDLTDQVTTMRDYWWGEVLTILNQAVASIRQGQLSTHPRMRLADWERLGRLLAHNEGHEPLWDRFCKDMLARQQDFLLEDNPIVEALDIWMEDPRNHGRELLTRELYEELTQALFGDKKPSSDWPKSVRGFGMRLAGIRSALRARYQVSWTPPEHKRQAYQFKPRGD